MIKPVKKNTLLRVPFERSFVHLLMNKCPREFQGIYFQNAIAIELFWGTLVKVLRNNKE